jgi:hypothetical protein
VNRIRVRPGGLVACLDGSDGPLPDIRSSRIAQAGMVWLVAAQCLGTRGALLGSGSLRERLVLAKRRQGAESGARPAMRLSR